MANTKPLHVDINIPPPNIFLDSVRYTEQDLTESQKEQARENINAQETLSSGNNIKTVNHLSLLGSGNINISGSGTTDFNQLENRPQYNSVVMNNTTNIPEVKTDIWDNKQDEITDLETIRIGAELGQTAYQKPTSGIPRSDLSDNVITVPNMSSTTALKVLSNDGTNPIWANMTSTTYIFNQMTSSLTWIINHNLNKYPSVNVVDSGGNVVIGEVTYYDMNNLVVTFSSPFSGKAYLN